MKPECKIRPNSRTRISDLCTEQLALWVCTLLAPKESLIMLDIKISIFRERRPGWCLISHWKGTRLFVNYIASKRIKIFKKKSLL